MKTFRSIKCDPTEDIALQSKVFHFDYYPVHQRFKDMIVEGMLTTIDTDSNIRNKACQTDEVRVYDRTQNLQRNSSIFGLTLFKEAEMSGRISI